MASLCEYLIKQDIERRSVELEETSNEISFDEVTEIIYNLLLDAYNSAEKVARLLIEEKITQGRDLGINENATKLELFTGCQKVVMSDRFSICTIMRNHNIRVFEAFVNIDKKDTFLRNLAQKTTEYHFDSLIYDARLFDKNVNDFARDKLYNEFSLAFCHYRFIEILKDQQLQKKIISTQPEIKSGNNNDNLSNGVKRPEPYTGNSQQNIIINESMIFCSGAFKKLTSLEMLLHEDSYIDDKKQWIAKHKNKTTDIKSLQIFIRGLQQNNYFLPKKNAMIRDFFELRYNIKIGQSFEQSRLNKLSDMYKTKFFNYDMTLAKRLKQQTLIRP